MTKTTKLIIQGQYFLSMQFNKDFINCVVKREKNESGKQVYFTSEEPNMVHSDRSPYNFEPADVGGGLVDFSQSGNNY